MNEDMLDYLVRMIKPLFPVNACIISCISGGDYIIQIDWRLQNDINYPNKRSRKIKIKISEDAIEDYLENKKERGDLYESRLRNLISQWYNVFNPHGDSGRPAENWSISKALLKA